ncbi:MAG: nucleotidyl transferase AbiEii/AbiGii toxin family protein [Rhabdochlamydiaceae bacterium]|nr:nucleotidyl transferase AbiEii/AbiGii toxin family protein [Rhabdochlamydiaceae bacterium]
MINQVITNWLKKYSCTSKDDYRNALQEIIQEIALEGLARAKFFEKAAFYGGTCLRILHRLDRFSEDLLFSLLSPDPTFQLEPYLKSVELHLRSYGFLISIIKKEKTAKSAVLSAFPKANTLENFIRIGLSSQDRQRVHLDENIKIKLEIDTDPPLGFETEMIEMHTPGLFYVKSYVLPDLFAGKMSAVLASEWRGRTKGRDWYDLVWYVAKKVPLHLAHLEKRLKQTAFIEEGVAFDPQAFSKLYLDRVEKLDVLAAKEDVVHFVRDSQALDIWSKSYFIELLAKITFC